MIPGSDSSPPPTPWIQAVSDLHKIGIHGLAVGGPPGHAWARGLLMHGTERDWYTACAASKLQAMQNLIELLQRIMDG